MTLCVQVQSQLIWGVKDKLKKNCSNNDMKELLIANGQEVPSGESNVRRLPPLSKCAMPSLPIYLSQITFSIRVAVIH